MGIKELEENKAAQIKLNKEINDFQQPRWEQEQKLKNEANKLIVQNIMDEKILSKHSWKWVEGSFQCEVKLRKYPELDKITEYHDWFYPHGSIDLTKNISLGCYDGELNIYMSEASAKEVKKFIEESQIKLDISRINENIKGLENQMRQLKLLKEKFGAKTK